MRRKQAEPLKDVLREYVRAMGMQRKLKVHNIKPIWHKLMGPVISGKTTNIYIKNQVLYVNLNSAVLRNELMMLRDKIVERVNEYVGDELIKDVVLR